MRSIPVACPCNLAAIDEPGPGGAHHHYAIRLVNGEIVEIRLQCGPLGEPGAVAGIWDDVLLAIVSHRMSDFQAGPFACEANAEVLRLVEAAREVLGQRVADRLKRGVLGKNQA